MRIYLSHFLDYAHIEPYDIGHFIGFVLRQYGPDYGSELIKQYLKDILSEDYGIEGE
ncbi:MAG TPA: hypothetical protein PLN56_10555 [Methanoregulaceae archaeon]|nr:hypothetical protein [Methanoregulaceae archaeon]